VRPPESPQIPAIGTLLNAIRSVLSTAYRRSALAIFGAHVLGPITHPDDDADRQCEWMYPRGASSVKSRRLVSRSTPAAASKSAPHRYGGSAARCRFARSAACTPVSIRPEGAPFTSTSSKRSHRAGAQPCARGARPSSDVRMSSPTRAHARTSPPLR